MKSSLKIKILKLIPVAATVAAVAESLGAYRKW